MTLEDLEKIADICEKLESDYMQKRLATTDFDIKNELASAETAIRQVQLRIMFAFSKEI